MSISCKVISISIYVQRKVISVYYTLMSVNILIIDCKYPLLVRSFVHFMHPSPAKMATAGRNTNRDQQIRFLSVTQL